MAAMVIEEEGAQDSMVVLREDTVMKDYLPNTEVVVEENAVTRREEVVAVEAILQSTVVRLLTILWVVAVMAVPQKDTVVVHLHMVAMVVEDSASEGHQVPDHQVEGGMEEIANHLWDSVLHQAWVAVDSVTTSGWVVAAAMGLIHMAVVASAASIQVMAAVAVTNSAVRHLALVVVRDLHLI